MSENKFKVQDRVKIVNLEAFEGRVGTVLAFGDAHILEKEYADYAVNLDNGPGGKAEIIYVWADQLETYDDPKRQHKKTSDWQRKFPLGRLTIHTLLNNACGNPEDFEKFEDWTEKGDPEHYPGWMRYSIKLHCVEIIVVAKKNKDGVGYGIREYMVRDH